MVETVQRVPQAVELPRPSLTLTQRRPTPPVENSAAQRQVSGSAPMMEGYSSAAFSSAPSLAASGRKPGLEVIQREVAATGSVHDAEPKKAEAAGRVEAAGAAQDVNLLAHEVWSLLKTRLGYEAERMGRR